MSSSRVSQGLGRTLAKATTLGIVVFVALVGVGLYLHEQHAVANDRELAQILVKLATVLAIATPIAIWLALRLGRRIIRATTDRLDIVIASASQLSGTNPGDRLPVSDDDDDLDRLARALNDSFERIERGIAAQAQFSADASHELRTPIAVISTKLEVARRRAREPAYWEQVADDVLAQTTHMQLLTEKLLALARAGATPLQLKRQELRELAASAVARAQQVAAERGVVVELTDGPPMEAEVDPEAMAIVLDNLLRNAVEHSPPGESVRIVVDSGPRIAVEDHGPGVLPDQRERILQPFARGSQVTDRASGPGVGLGLAICARLVAAHHGSIQIEDRPGGGARFVVRLSA